MQKARYKEEGNEKVVETEETEGLEGDYIFDEEGILHLRPWLPKKSETFVQLKFPFD